MSDAHVDERDALVDTIKAQLEKKTEEFAQLQARSDRYAEKERSRVGAWQPDCRWLVDNLVEGADAECKADLAPISTWVDEFSTKSNVDEQVSLARTLCMASKKLKRSLDVASKGEATAEALADALKQNEVLMTSNAKVQKSFEEMKDLCQENQAEKKMLIDEIEKQRLSGEKFDFSRLSSREGTSAASEPSAASAGPSVLQTVSCNASKNKIRANPMESGLLSFITSVSSAGSSQMTGSGTSHSLLGSVDSSTDSAQIARLLSGM